MITGITGYLLAKNKRFSSETNPLPLKIKIRPTDKLIRKLKNRSTEKEGAKTKHSSKKIDKLIIQFESVLWHTLVKNKYLRQSTLTQFIIKLVIRIFGCSDVS